MTKTYRPYLALVMGVIMLAFSAIFIRWANAPGVISSFYRMFIAAIIFIIPFSRRRRIHVKHSRYGVGLALLSGLFFGADMAFWSEGVMLSGATNPTLMANTAPAWVGIGALIIFKERLNNRFWIGLIIALIGAAIILGLDSLRQLDFGIGTFYGLIAGIFYGGFFLIAQRGRAHIDTISFFWFSVLGSTILLFLIGAARGLSFIDYPKETFLYFLAAGLISQVGGWFALNYAQGYLPATMVSPSLLGQPIMTTILAIILLQEKFSALQGVGAAAIILGIYVVHRSQQQIPGRHVK